MTEVKPRSVVRQTADDLIDTIAVLEQLDGIIPDDCHFTVAAKKLECWPSSHDVSRKIVGGLIRKLKSKPEIRKWGATELEAKFEMYGVTVLVNRYRGKKCAVVKKTVVHEAEPEKVVPAKEAWVETVEELVCEMDAVETEVEEAVPA